MLMTTLDAEIKYFDELTAKRLASYTPPPVPEICRTALRIIFSHREKGVKLSPEDINDLNKIVDYYIGRDEPIVITLSFAVCRIPNRLKFHEDTVLPTYAWMHLSWFFSYINQKVQKFYAPGIKVVVFDEATLFADIVGLNPVGVENCIAASRKIFSAMNSPIEIIEMRPEMFPAGIEPVKVDPDRIYAMACSLPEMQNQKAMNQLYQNRDRDYLALHRLIGEEIWRKAEHAAGMVNATLAWRKQINLFRQTLNAPYIDACITQKHGRLVFDISSCALINHGLPVVTKNGNGQHKMLIIPEYRVAATHPEAKPIFLDPAELGYASEPFTFYYQGGKNA